MTTGDLIYLFSFPVVRQWLKWFGITDSLQVGTLLWSGEKHRHQLQIIPRPIWRETTGTENVTRFFLDVQIPIHPQSDLISENHRMCRHPFKKKKKREKKRDSLCLPPCANSIFITLFKNTHNFRRKQRAEADCHLASDKKTASY